MLIVARAHIYVLALLRVSIESFCAVGGSSVFTSGMGSGSGMDVDWMGGSMLRRSCGRDEDGLFLSITCYDGVEYGGVDQASMDGISLSRWCT